MGTQLLRYLVSGWLVLVTAVLVNVAAKFLGIRTWYDYLEGISSSGLFTTTRSLHPLEALFLFVVYPGVFGFLIYLLKG